MAIAEAFVDEIEDGSFGGEVDTVILTSGVDEHFGYVLPAPALSRRRQAPVLLTEPDELPGAVREFIVSHGIVEVVILGGGDVVSAEVEREVDGLSGVSVERIAGRDVYATAVEVAKTVGPSIRFPGRFSRTVLLATGETFADALAAGPLAYVGPHPMLLTRTSVMSAELVDFLEDSDTEHVVILGGFDAVSLDVQLEIEDLDLAVTRWRGVTRYETAIEIAEALLASDWPQDCFVGAEVGLAYAWRSPDAIVSGPYLGELCAPLLLVDRRVLPAAVRDVLEAEDLFVGDSLGELRITVFGGTAAISGSVLRSAVDAAELGSLSARVAAVVGGCHFTVIFDEPVLTVDAENPRNYLIESVLLDLGDADVDTTGFGDWTREATVTFDGASAAASDAVPTGCPAPLGVGDRVGVAAQRIRSATDRRTVERVEFRVGADRTRPRLAISAPRRATTVLISANEPIIAATGESTMEVEFRRGGLEPVVVIADVTPGGTVVRVPVPGAFATGTSIGLLAGDQVLVRADQVTDLVGNGNFHTARTS